MKMKLLKFLIWMALTIGIGVILIYTIPPL